MKTELAVISVVLLLASTVFGDEMAVTDTQAQDKFDL